MTAAAILWRCGAGIVPASFGCGVGSVGGADVSLALAGSAAAGGEMPAADDNVFVTGPGLAGGDSADAGGVGAFAVFPAPLRAAPGAGFSTLITTPTMSTPASVRTPVRAQLSQGKPLSSSGISEAKAKFLVQVPSPFGRGLG